MKGLILFRGLTFRGPGKMCRTLECSEISYNLQINATNSHKKLVDHLVSQGNEIDVAFDTVECEKTFELIDLFGNNLRYINLKNIMDFDTQFSLFRAIMGLELAFLNVDYDFFLIIRNDMFLKDTFIEIFDPTSEKIMFPSVQWYRDRKTPRKNPRVNDCIFFIPKKYLDLRLCFPVGPGADHHYILDDWLELLPSLDFGFYLNGYHDSNTEIDWNPLYMLVNRPEAEKQDSDPNLKYPDDF
jgi:hypothetical protein